MDKKRTTLNAEFGTDIWFADAPQAAAPLRATLEKDLEGLKARLLRGALEDAGSALGAPLRRAANDAAALAWLLPHPLLLLPELFHEKARAAVEQALRQERIRAHTRGLIAKAA